VSITDALRLAQEADLDLVEVAPTARPPVCKLMDYGKFKYESALKARESRKNQAQTVIKEIKIRPKIDPHDYGTKKGHVERFLKQGDKVKVTIMFRGREQSRPELGYKLLQRLAGDVDELGFVESAPKQDGRNMIMVIGPHRKKAETRPARTSERASARASAPAGAGQSLTDDDDSELSTSSESQQEAFARAVSQLPTAAERAERAEQARVEQVEAAAVAASRPAVRPSSAPSGAQRPASPRPGPAAASGSAAPRPAASSATASSGPRPSSAGAASATAGSPRPGPASAAPRPAAPRPASSVAPKPGPGPAGAPRPAPPRPMAPRPGPSTSGTPRPAAPKPTAPRPAAAKPASEDAAVPSPRAQSADDGAGDSGS
jgi:translation initiation factor IF-3